jgi:hypothetical protein
LEHALQVYAEDMSFVSALCKAATNGNRTHPLPVHISVVTGAVSGTHMSAPPMKIVAA